MLNYPELKFDTNFESIQDSRLCFINRDRLKLVVHLPESLFDVFDCLDFAFLLLPFDLEFHDNDLIYLSVVDDDEFDSGGIDSGLGCLSYVHSRVAMSTPNMGHIQIVTVGFSNL